MKGYFHEDALNAYNFLAADKEGVDFAEGDTYDFTRCVRPDGSAYGTRGKCRQGSEAGPADRRGTGRKGADAAAEKARAEGKKGGEINRARAAGKKEALAAARKAGGAKISAGNARARLYQELIKNNMEKFKKLRDNPDASAALHRRLLAEADRRAKAGEGKAK